MTATLVITDPIGRDLLEKLALPIETAGVLLARRVDSTAGIRLLARELLWVPEGSYTRREAAGLTVSSDGYVHSLGRAESTTTVPIWFHTHPGVIADPGPSWHDAIVDEQLSEVFRLRSGSFYYGSVIFSPRDPGFAFSGFLEGADHNRRPIQRVVEVGERLRLTVAVNVPAAEDETLSPAFDRNVRAFGPAVQRTLSRLEVGVVGCGGTGSAVVELLTRLGARRLTLIDPDVLSASNVTRMYGSGPSLVGLPKTDVLKLHVESIAPDAKVHGVVGNVTDLSVATRLLGCDVLFGCTDDNAGRLVLSRFSSYMLVPVIDCGVLLTSGPGGDLTGIHGRVTTLVPGQACLLCRNRIDVRRAAAESLPAEERQRLVAEGYAPGLGPIEPAVVTFTTSVAALAVSELLERLIGFGSDERPSELLYLGHDRHLSTNRQAPNEGHYCDIRSGKIGLGMTDPLLERTWPDSA